MDEWKLYTQFYTSCPWYYLDNSHKILLGSCTTVFGITGILLNCWMVTTFHRSHLLIFKSHLLVLNLSFTCLARGILGGFPFSGSSAIGGKWLFGEPNCQLFALMNQLLGVFEVAALTALCLERYLLTKRMNYGKNLGFMFYILTVIVCWIFSVMFAIPPIFKYGSYGCDVSGTVCSLDWRFTNKKQSAFNIPLALFVGVFPTILIILSLWKATTIKGRTRRTEIEWEQWSLTKSAICVSFFMLLLWTPQVILTTWLWSEGYCQGANSTICTIPPVLVLLASLATEASNLVPFLCYLACDPRIRTALLGRCKKDYGIIRGVNKFQGFRRINQS